MLAQIGDIPEAMRATGNSNSDNTHSAGAAGPAAGFENDDINDKIDIETEASLGGLTAKEEFILEKLRWLAHTGIESIREEGLQCKEKVLEGKAAGTQALDAALASSTAQAKQCRVDFVAATLTEKEIVKGRLEELLNAAIQDIKELKVQGVFSENGIPGGDHVSVIETDIAAVLLKFDEATGSMALQLNTNEFESTTNADSGSCLDEIERTYNQLYTISDAGIGSMLQGLITGCET